MPVTLTAMSYNKRCYTGTWPRHSTAYVLLEGKAEDKWWMNAKVLCNISRCRFVGLRPQRLEASNSHLPRDDNAIKNLITLQAARFISVEACLLCSPHRGHQRRHVRTARVSASPSLHIPCVYPEQGRLAWQVGWLTTHSICLSWAGTSGVASWMAHYTFHVFILSRDVWCGKLDG
jgi:hypothetical protein